MISIELGQIENQVNRILSLKNKTNKLTKMAIKRVNFTKTKKTIEEIKG